MRKNTTLPVPLFRSDTQASLLSALFMSAKGLTMQELSDRLGIAYPTVHREIGRLYTSDLVTEERIGNYRIFTPNRTSPFYAPLRDLLEVFTGPIPLLRNELALIPGIKWTALFGSWAQRVLGKTGKAPQDVDVMVVGTPDVRRVNKACTVVGKKFGWDVNPVILTPLEWLEETPFLRQVRADGLVPVFGTIDRNNDHESSAAHINPTKPLG